MKRVLSKFQTVEFIENPSILTNQRKFDVKIKIHFITGFSVNFTDSNFEIREYTYSASSGIRLKPLIK